jgi:hypothetical protein
LAVKYAQVGPMARQIQTLIKMSKSQTREFLASLSSNKNNKNRDETFARVRKAKFNVVL